MLGKNKLFTVWVWTFEDTYIPLGQMALKAILEFWRKSTRHEVDDVRAPGKLVGAVGRLMSREVH